MFYVLSGGLSILVIVVFRTVVVDAQAEGKQLAQNLITLIDNWYLSCEFSVCSLAVNPSALPIRQIFENQTSGLIFYLLITFSYSINKVYINYVKVLKFSKCFTDLRMPALV